MGKKVFLQMMYNIIDLEYAHNRIIIAYKSIEEYQEPWNKEYYKKLIHRIEQYMERKQESWQDEAIMKILGDCVKNQGWKNPHTA